MKQNIFCCNLTLLRYVKYSKITTMQILNCRVYVKLKELKIKIKEKNVFS